MKRAAGPPTAQAARSQSAVMSLGLHQAARACWLPGWGSGGGAAVDRATPTARQGCREVGSLHSNHRPPRLGLAIFTGSRVPGDCPAAAPPAPATGDCGVLVIGALAACHGAGCARRWQLETWTRRPRGHSCAPSPSQLLDQDLRRHGSRVPARRRLRWAAVPYLRPAARARPDLGLIAFALLHRARGLRGASPAVRSECGIPRQVGWGGEPLRIPHRLQCSSPCVCARQPGTATTHTHASCNACSRGDVVLRPAAAAAAAAAAGCGPQHGVTQQAAQHARTRRHAATPPPPTTQVHCQTRGRGVPRGHHRAQRHPRGRGLGEHERLHVPQQPEQGARRCKGTWHPRPPPPHPHPPPSPPPPPHPSLP